MSSEAYPSLVGLTWCDIRCRYETGGSCRHFGKDSVTPTASVSAALTAMASKRTYTHPGITVRGSWVRGMQEVDKAAGETLGASGKGDEAPTSHFRAPCKRRHSIADDNLSVPKSAPHCKTSEPIEHVLDTLLDAWQLDQPYIGPISGSSSA